MELNKQALAGVKFRTLGRWCDAAQVNAFMEELMQAVEQNALELSAAHKSEQASLRKMDSLYEEKAQLLTEIEALRRDLGELDGFKEALIREQQTCEQLRQQLEEQQPGEGASRELQEQLEREQAKSRMLTAQVETLTAAAASLPDRSDDDLARQIEELARERDALAAVRQQLEHEKEKNSELTAQIETLTASVTSLSRQSDADLARQTEELARERDALTTIRLQLEQEKAKNNELAVRVENYTTAVAQKEQEAAVIERKWVEQQAENALLRTQLERLHQLCEENARLLPLVEKLKSERTSSGGVFVASGEDVQRIRQLEEELAEQRKVLEEQQTAADRKVRSLEVELAAHQAFAQKKQEEADQYIHELETDRDSLWAARDSLQRELDRLNDPTFETELMRDRRLTVEDMERRRDELIEDVKALQALRRQLRDSLEQESGRLNRALQEMDKINQ